MWSDIRNLSQRWRRVLIPTPSTFDRGVSEAVYSSFHSGMVVNKESPVVYMRAQKNQAEREGMHRAHIRDAAAMCETLAYLEERVCMIFCIKSSLKNYLFLSLLLEMTSLNYH